MLFPKQYDNVNEHQAQTCHNCKLYSSLKSAICNICEAIPLRIDLYRLEVYTLPKLKPNFFMENKRAERFFKKSDA